MSVVLKPVRRSQKKPIRPSDELQRLLFHLAIFQHVCICLIGSLISPVTSLKTASLWLLRNTEQLVYCGEGSDFLSGAWRTGMSFFTSAPTVITQPPTPPLGGSAEKKRHSLSPKDGALGIWKKHCRHTIRQTWDFLYYTEGWRSQQDQKRKTFDVKSYIERGRCAWGGLQGKVCVCTEKANHSLSLLR